MPPAEGQTDGEDDSTWEAVRVAVRDCRLPQAEFPASRPDDHLSSSFVFMSMRKVTRQRQAPPSLEDLRRRLPDVNAELAQRQKYPTYRYIDTELQSGRVRDRILEVGRTRRRAYDVAGRSSSWYFCSYADAWALCAVSSSVLEVCSHDHRSPDVACVPWKGSRAPAASSPWYDHRGTGSHETRDFSDQAKQRRLEGA